ncbi:MAG: hypothetical protein ACI4N4_02035 [Candidatus Fimenecus sp.]
MKVSEKNLNMGLEPIDFNSLKIFYGYVYSVWGRKYKKSDTLYYTLSLYSDEKKNKGICKLWLTEEVYFSLSEDFKRTKEFFCCISFYECMRHHRSGAIAYIYDPEYIKLYDRDKAKLTILLSKLCDLEDEGRCALFADCGTEETERCCSPLKCPPMLYEAECLMEQGEEYKEILTIESEDSQLIELKKLLDKYWNLMW